jgi:hypothetical protein
VQSHNFSPHKSPEALAELIYRMQPLLWSSSFFLSLLPSASAYGYNAYTDGLSARFALSTACEGYWL